MPSIEYSLFRAKFVKPDQLPLFNPKLAASDFFLNALAEQPHAQFREGYDWHIGKVEFFSDSAGTFKIGRTAKGIIEIFDEVSGDFLVEETETSPYTHCVFDARLGIVGIARKANLAPDARGIATKLQQLLSKASLIRQNRISVEIDPIPDPEDFLAALSSAYQVSSFSATFRGPNPLDADEYFQKPLSRLLSVARGKRGRAQVQGQDLNREFLESITRSTAATGNRASARVRKKRLEKSVTIKLEGAPITAKYERDEHKPAQVLEDLTGRYESVRQHEDR